MTRALEARSEVEAKVFGLLQDTIPAAILGTGGGAMKTVRDRMACVPDLRLGLQVPSSPAPQPTTRPGARFCR